MGANTKIEWTDASLNPIRARHKETGKVGWHCEHSTTGCEFCYSESINKRLGTGLAFKPGHRKDVEMFLDEKMLGAPMRWKRPRMIFVCSMTDLFADFVPDEWIASVFAVMAMCPQHTFQVLTKRAERMQAWTSGWRPASLTERGREWPLPNVWLGVSAERQQEADERLPYLINSPSAVRFLSAEPLLGPILLQHRELIGGKVRNWLGEGGLNWCIVGGESGPSARPMRPEWVRSLRDQHAGTGAAFFFKQWGSHAPASQVLPGDSLPEDADTMLRTSKAKAGRLLDGRLWDEMPRAKLEQAA